MFELENKGYSLDPATGVWIKPEYQGIAYSDGDAKENRLATVIRECTDLSVLSSELSQHCVDWASLYHLSPARGNILRPFERYLKGSVLEIGAGCGAISRFLGECGGNILSLEGSPRRAQIAASRTRDLTNVTVLAERFDDFHTDEKFDAITLIGVLEYASMFSSDNDPAAGMLRKVFNLLKPEGKLFIAIENQLGLKYFAGAPEDHLGIAMYGIEGRYLRGQPKTFGRKALETLIEQAGFKKAEFLAPCPDYKIPNSITTELGFKTELFDSAALSAQNVKKDPQLPEHILFDLERAWPVVVENGLGIELANSFLVAASKSTDAAIDCDILGYHYSTGRKKTYCKESRFISTPNGIEVQYLRLSNTPEDEVVSDFRFILPDADNYVSGKVFSQEFLNIAATANWTVFDFGKFVREYIRHLEVLLAATDTPIELNHVSNRLPGYFIDAVPQNILIDKDRNPKLIDIEWEVVGGFELGHLLMRALLLSIASADPFPAGDMPPSRRQFVIGAMDAAGLHVTGSELESYIAKEALFQEKVTGRTAAEFLNWSPDEPVGKPTSSVRPDMHARLYYSDADGQFSENSALSIEVLLGQQTISFPFNEFQTATKKLRFDPVDTRMTFSLSNLRIAAGETCLWSWDGHLDSLDSRSGVLQVEKPDSSIFFLSIDNDPHFELPVDMSLVEDIAQLELTVDLTLYTDDKIAGQIKLEQKIEQDRRDEQQALIVLQLSINKKLNDLLARTESELTEMKAAMAADGSALVSDQSPDLTEDQQYSLSRESRIERLELELESQRVAKDTHIHNLNLRIMALEGSTSWAITSPLRKSGGAIKQVRHVAKLLPSVIRRGGGLKATTKKAIAVMKRQGMQGLVARIRWLSGANSFEFVGQETREVLDRHDYATWIKYYDTLDDNGRWKIKEQIRSWNRKPLISIIMPVYNPPIELLREAIDSVKLQLYGNWELCIADDASTNPDVRDYLLKAQKADKRIKVVFRTANGHISAASNSALGIAKGEYVALMDNDDLLSESALYWVARTIIENPQAGLIYSDEDKIDSSRQRSAPYFKSDWNAFLFRSQNMICHLGVYRRDLVELVGQFRIGFEGAQDYDLALRCIEKLDPSEIIHIPRVLYHWRIHPGSTAMAGDEKPYAALAGVKALDEHLERTGCAAKTELLPMGMYRVHYNLPEQLPLVSLIIPTRNAHALVRQCIDSIIKLTTYPNYEIILIDNGSDEQESLDYFTELNLQPNISVLRDDGPFNYSALNNKAVTQSRGELIGLINNDIEVITPGWLDEMVAIALQPNVGAVGARLWYPDDRLQHGGVIVGVGGVAGHSHKYLPKGDYGYFCRAAIIQELSAVTAACLIIRKSIFEQVDGLDEAHLKIAFNDVDFCLRVQEAGYINVWTPFAEMYHYESATRGLEDTPQKKERFMQEVIYIKSRWPNIQSDYAYNPNLTLDHEDFGLAWPPRVKV